MNGYKEIRWKDEDVERAHREKYRLVEEKQALMNFDEFKFGIECQDYRMMIVEVYEGDWIEGNEAVFSVNEHGIACLSEGNYKYRIPEFEERIRAVLLNEVNT